MLYLRNTWALEKSTGLIPIRGIIYVEKKHTQNLFLLDADQERIDL